MSDLVRGWCPSLFEPMASGDGLLLRIKPRASRLAAAEARWIAAGCRRWGNGAIELTSRGNLQLRGFDVPGAARFAAEAAAAGLAATDPDAERRRNVLVSPLAGIDPGCDPATLDMAHALEAALVGDRSLDGLTAKFGFLVDGGGALGLQSVRADIALRASPSGWRIECGDAASPCAVANAPQHALRLAHATLAVPDGPLRPARRPERGAALFAAAGLPSQPIGIARVAPPVSVGPLLGTAFGIGLPPGRLDAELLIRLADLAERFGDGTLRVTPWRTLLLAGLDGRAVGVLRASLTGHLIEPSDPRLRTAACIGAPGCARGSVTAPADASYLGARLPAGLFLHVSGCAKGCAHPESTPLTLVGRDGAYDLVRDGRAGDKPVLQGLTVAAAEALLHQAAIRSDDAA